jgi:hypothetical protein
MFRRFVKNVHEEYNFNTQAQNTIFNTSPKFVTASFKIYVLSFFVGACDSVVG